MQARIRMLRPVPSTQDFQFIAGSLCLDFVNTVGNRLGSSRDYFTTPKDVLRWSRRTENLFGLGSIRITGADLSDIRRRREYLYALFLPFAHGKTGVSSPALTGLNRDIAALSHGRVLRCRGAKVKWTFQGSGAERLAHAIVSDAAELLATGLCTRIRQCQDPSCGWLYLDRSRENNRRWCSMADCGNRAKARRYYAQHHGRSAE
jgi:predicted RNA-binding Zn ribbon-like protein